MISDALGVSVVANVVRRWVLSACLSLSSLGLCLLWGGWGLYWLGWLWVEEVSDRSLVRVKSMVSGDDV